MKAKLISSLIHSLKNSDKPFEVNDVVLRGFLARVQPTGGITYYFTYRDSNGRKQRFRIGRHPAITVSAARKAAEGLAASVAQGRSPHAEKKARKEAYVDNTVKVLGQFVERRYSPWIIAHSKRGQETIALLRHNFARLWQRELSEISINDVEHWRIEAHNSGLASSSLNRRTSALKALLNKAVDWEIIDRNPIARLKPLKVDNNRRVRFLTEPEENALRQALIQREKRKWQKRRSGVQWRELRGYSAIEHVDDPEDYLQPIVLLALNTGMRRGELFSLRWADLDVARRQLTIEGAYAKSGQTRHIDLNKEAFAVLIEWQKRWGNHELVFPNPRTGERFDNIKSGWSNLRKEAGLSDFRFHDLRHTFASKLVMAGVDLYVVKELLGHSTIEMTERYAHLAPSAKREAVAKLD